MNITKTLLRTGLASVAMMASIILVGPTPLTASAAVSPLGLESCAAGRLCRWSGTNYQGTLSTVSTTGAVVDVRGTWRSLYVNRSSSVVLYSGSGGSGTSLCLGPGRTAPSLSGWQSYPGSVRLLSTGCP